MSTLQTAINVSEMIKNGDYLLLAGDKAVLDTLPKGNWIGGTIPYFMSELGGLKTKDKIFTLKIPKDVIDFKVISYSESELYTIPKSYFPNGFSYIIIPPFSKVLTSFAENCATYDNLFESPLIGWVAGFDLDDKTQKCGNVYNGLLGESYTDKAIVIHFKLDERKKAKMNLINLFKQGNGDIISFDQTGFTIKDCRINGDLQNFATYLKINNIDITLPLVTSFRDFNVNVSFKSINEENNTVELYAPVFENTDYQLASPIGIYEDEFNDEILNNRVNPFFSCNCILNYFYANLEGKKTGNIQGPITFGEIAHILLNQTMVYVAFEDH